MSNTAPVHLVSSGSVADGGLIKVQPYRHRVMANQQEDVPIAPGTHEDQGYYTRYVPLWSDPERSPSGRRPAMLPGDQYRNPSQYAVYV